MEDFIPKEKKEKKKINQKKLILLISIIVLAIIIAVISIVYAANKDFRDFLDKYVFHKNISQENVTSIEADYESNSSVFAYNKSICILVEHTLKEYNASGKLENEVKIEINTPIFHANANYLVIGEKNSQKLYLISSSNVVWEKTIEGNISKVNVNDNGYVSIIVTGTTYRSVIITYDNKGNELFKTYLSNTTVIDTEISADNRYLAFAEVNTAGTMIQSNIKIVSIEKAKQTPAESIVYTYGAPSNSLIININYQEKNKLVCLYDDSVHIINNDVDETILSLVEKDKKITFADIELENYTYRTIEKSSGIFSADTTIEMMNIASKKQTIYTADGVIKTITCYKDLLAINLGTEINFINTNGWLIKRYTTSQEVKDIVVGNNVAAIVYRDRVEFVNL